MASKHLFPWSAQAVHTCCMHIPEQFDDHQSSLQNLINLREAMMAQSGCCLHRQCNMCNQFWSQISINSEGNINLHVFLLGLSRNITYWTSACSHPFWAIMASLNTQHLMASVIKIQSSHHHFPTHWCQEFHCSRCQTRQTLRWRRSCPGCFSQNCKSVTAVTVTPWCHKWIGMDLWGWGI